MASDPPPTPPLRWRRAAGRSASGVALVTAGAVLVLAWQQGWWATAFGAATGAAWIVATGGRSALREGGARVADATASAGAGPLPIGSLVDQVPVPLVRTDEAGVHAINRAARTLFATDDRILPPPPALLGGAGARLRHAGRSWRIDGVDTAPGQRLAALIDVAAEERAAEGRAGDEMIDILGHELLNGLSPIVSLADSAVTAAQRNDAALPGILATLARRVEGLEGFTRAYRTLSRLPDPVMRPVPLDELGDDLARLFASRFGATVALGIGGVRGHVAQVDRDQFTQALWALLQNGAEAALAGAEPRRVDVTVVAGRGLAIRVADSGAGVAAADRARIFRPFFTTRPQGSGIGLSLARRIVRAHGGEVRLLDVEPTTFEVACPPWGSSG